MKFPQVLLTALAVSLLTSVALAQRADNHLLADGAQSLYRRSAFAHGYIHGYEEGFHAANLDWHMGRTRPDLTKQLHVSKNTKRQCGYAPEYGDHKNFMKGFEQGYAEAYNDVFSDQSFRAIAEARAAAEGLDASGPHPSRTFDDGFLAGVTAAREGTAPAKDLSGTTEWCIQNLHSSSPDYCDAYARGIVFESARSIQKQGDTQSARAALR